MADHDRWQGRSVEELLYADASRFTFLQAVRLLEEIELRRPVNRNHVARLKSPSESAHYEHELLFFRHKVRFDMPPTDVEKLERHHDDQPPTMTTNVLGLAGGLGPLPQTVTEAVVEELRQGRRAFADFLDIFNHRLISLLYGAKKKYLPALDPHGPQNGRVSRVLYAFLGLGTPDLKGRVLGDASDEPPVVTADRPLLAYAGLFTETFRSPIGLERIVEDCFGVDATIEPFIGAWEEIDPKDRTAIGVTKGRNNVLGSSALAGRRIWNQAARFEVRLGPMTLQRFRSFLPAAKDAHKPLVSLIRFYAHEELAFNVRLVLAKEEIPELCLERKGSAYLGQTTWLHRRTPERPTPKHDDQQVRLVGQR